MNKRQRKKQHTRIDKQIIEMMQQLRHYDKQSCQLRFLEPHPRRHWLSPTEYQRRCAAITAELQLEKETHIQVLAEKRDYLKEGAERYQAFKARLYEKETGEE